MGLIQRKRASARASFLIASALFLASCELGARQLCCGYETREDWSSDVSIVDGESRIVFQHVSAIAEQADAYVVEIRETDPHASGLTYKDCRYARIEKRTGARSLILNAQYRVALDERLTSGNAQFVLRTQNSCLVDMS
ncbi:hypothetical protein GCM10022281_15210 [Sphingomonas rosea]|uniref:Lipoprotein n=1 Tax=Sphingomonas rosea TaxID=335605 RepID=A0ABP7U428_9SPHN